MASFTISLPMMSCISCVTTPTLAQNFLAVLYINLMYSAMSGEAIAFHASSITRTFRFFFRRIFCKNTSMMISVTIGKSFLFSLIASTSKTIKVSENSVVSTFSLRILS